MKDQGVIANFDDEIARLLAGGYGGEIRKLADVVDNAEPLSHELDDIAEELKGHLGSKAMNQVDEEEADDALDTVDDWVANNVSNSSTSRRIAAAYALLGREEARRRLEQDTPTYRVRIEEIQHHSRIYTVAAANEEEALQKAMSGETEHEEDQRFHGVIERKNASLIKD